MEMVWFVEALQMVMAAMSDDKPQADEAINGDESEKWKARMEDIFQIEKLLTWDIILPPPDTNIVPSK